MSYTFGGATADDITLTGQYNINANGSATLWCGWFYPTTLTATRTYFSAGNVTGLTVDTTTSELRYIADNVTTDAVYTTTTAGITVNNWWFIAVLTAQANATPVAAVKIWVGDVLALNELTVTTTTAPVGNFSGTNSRTIGNKGTGTLAFQGDIGWVSQIGTGATTTRQGPLGIEAAGVISQAEADLNLNRWIRPLWLGRPNLLNLSWSGPAIDCEIMHFALENGAACYRWMPTDAATFPPVTIPTINGATYSMNSPPRSPPENWPLLAPWVRR